MNNFKFTERHFFILIIGLNLIPVIAFKFFPTLDGPAHLYNSNLIINLIQGNNQLTDFFILNPEMIPNWSGHFILSFFNFILPAFLAEKILLLFYMIALPLSYRALITTVSPNNILFSYFIFPFTYSFTFYLGFYNFSVALIFMLITLNFWIQNEENSFTIKKGIKLFLLILLTYFSHILVFALLLLILGMHVIIQFSNYFFANEKSTKDILKIFLPKITALFFSSIIPLLFFVNYFLSRPTSTQKIFLPFNDLFHWLLNIRPIIALNMQEEAFFTEKLAYIMALIFLIGIYTKFKTTKSTLKTSIKNKTTAIILWLLSSIIIIILYFTLADSDQAAGFVSVRLGLIFFLLFTLWLSNFQLPKWLLILLFSGVLYLNFKLNINYFKASKDLNEIAMECNNASELIAPNSVVLPINYSNNWLLIHFSNYLGIDKPMVILENYECGTGYFPIKWNEQEFPSTILDNISNQESLCLNWKSNAAGSPCNIDYVFVLGDNPQSDSCSSKANLTILKNYSLIYHTTNCKLYQHK